MLHGVTLRPALKARPTYFFSSRGDRSAGDYIVRPRPEIIKRCKRNRKKEMISSRIIMAKMTSTLKRVSSYLAGAHFRFPFHWPSQSQSHSLCYVYIYIEVRVRNV